MDETTTNTHPPILRTLLQSFPTAVHTPNSPTYPPLNAAFWNLDNALTHPFAILTPSTASETALLLSHLAASLTPFAIRSGGYSPLHNTSPSLLLSTSRLTALSLNPDDTVSIGAGLTWGAVYDFLTPHGLVVPGARARPVGVAGFLLHGGISHFYAEAGWACEAVVAFEVALADGRVVRAAAGGEHAELYWALKGGGKNFGVVTAFTMRTRRLGRMWGGQRVVRGGEGVAERVLGEVHALHGERGEENEKAHAEVIAVFDPSVCEGGEEMFVLQLAWAGEEGGEVEALKGFREGECVVDGTRWTTQGELAGDDGSFVGFDKRGLFRTFTHRGPPSLTLSLHAHFFSAIQRSPLSTHDPTAVAALLWQPRSRALSSGTGVLSLGETASPYVWGTIAFRWSDPDASKAMHQIADGIVEDIKTRLREANAFVEWTYANVAGKQDVTFKGLPEGTRRRLREVGARYDPKGVFAELVPGFGLA